jgi:hypothetical protein
MRIAPDRDFWSWKFIRSARSGKRPGYYCSILAASFAVSRTGRREMLWTDSLRETYAAIYKTVKTARPKVPGWHIWHNNSFNPIYRAEQDSRARNIRFY